MLPANFTKTLSFFLPALLLVVSCSSTEDKIDIKKSVSSGTTTQVEKTIPTQITQNTNNANISNRVETIAPENQSTELSTNIQLPSTKITKCINLLEDPESKNALSYWKDILDKFYPTFPGVMPGDLCTLNTGGFLLTAALDGYYSPKNPNLDIKRPEEPYKKVILFDSAHRHVLSTTGLTCPNAGDIGVPTINKEASFKNNAIIITCNSGDAGHTLSQTIRINTKDFSFGMIKEIHTGPAEGYITDDENQVYIETTKELQSDGTWKITEKKI